MQTPKLYKSHIEVLRLLNNMIKLASNSTFLLGFLIMSDINDMTLIDHINLLLSERKLELESI